MLCNEWCFVMAFANRVNRESLSDIVSCLAPQAEKPYHMGLRRAARCFTLADANERRDARTYAKFTHRLISRARKLYPSALIGIELDNIVYALDFATIYRCLSVFPWPVSRKASGSEHAHHAGPAWRDSQRYSCL